MTLSALIRNSNVPVWMMITPWKSCISFICSAELDRSMSMLLPSPLGSWWWCYTGKKACTHSALFKNEVLVLDSLSICDEFC